VLRRAWRLPAGRCRIPRRWRPLLRRSTPPFRHKDNDDCDEDDDQEQEQGGQEAKTEKRALEVVATVPSTWSKGRDGYSERLLREGAMLVRDPQHDVMDLPRIKRIRGPCDKAIGPYHHPLWCRR